jgi:hypothetical protein
MTSVPDTNDTPGAVRRTAVMADVAKLAGVSHQTVSRVINDSAHVRPETRDRVLAAMRRLDYRPNLAARALVTGRSRTLGVVSFVFTMCVEASTLFAIEQAAHAAGYFITIVSLLVIDRTSVLGAIERLRVQGVDGILVITPHEGAAEALVNLPTGVPVVAVEAGRPNSVPLVAVDQFSGAASATQLRRSRPSTAWHIAARATSSRPSSAPRAGARRSTPPAPKRRRCLSATGARARATSWACGWPRTARSRPSSSPTTRWRSECCAPCTRPARDSREVNVVRFDDIPEAQYFLPP